MSRADPQFNLRLPPALRDAIEKARAISGRSATAEIVFRLEESFRQNNRESETIAAINRLTNELAKAGSKDPKIVAGKKELNKLGKERYPAQEASRVESVRSRSGRKRT
jgi:hypothetical protein